MDCPGVTKYVTIWLQWNQVIIAIMMFIGGLIHLHNKLDGEDWCGNEHDSDRYNCVGKSLVWKTKGDTVEDTNVNWRSVFTLTPDDFCDAWTPFFYGILAMTQHFPTLKMDVLVGTWGKCLGFWLLATFWSIFGYAGNFGVFWGFWTTIGVCPFFLLLAMVDPEEQPKTQANLHVLLERVGLAAPLEDEEIQKPNTNPTYNEYDGEYNMN